MPRVDSCSNLNSVRGGSVSVTPPSRQSEGRASLSEAATVGRAARISSTTSSHAASRDSRVSGPPAFASSFLPSSTDDVSTRRRRLGSLAAAGRSRRTAPTARAERRQRAVEVDGSVQERQSDEQDLEHQVR